MAKEGPDRIEVSPPHVSRQHPYPHIDIQFIQGRMPGQMVFPFGKLHVPFNPPSGPCQPDFRQ